jgi:sugar phosphate isomerase/epimerase
VFVAASTACFSDMPLVEAIERLGDLEYSAVSIHIDEDGTQLKPSDVVENLEKVIRLCRDTHRLDLAAYFLSFNAPWEEKVRQFEACCKLAKATKVVSLAIRSSEQGTPFNEEVEQLREMVKIATLEGVLVSILMQVGRMSEDPDTIQVLCDNVKGLGITFDPSVIVCGAFPNRNYDKIMKYVYHVHLRDSTRSNFQVRVGQGDIEYGRIITQLQRVQYRRALCVDIREMPDTDHTAEVRKMRLLLESLL